MKRAILEEKEVKGADGNLIGTQRITADEKSLEEYIRGKNDKDARKEHLRSCGWTEEHLTKLDDEGLLDG